MLAAYTAWPGICTAGVQIKEVLGEPRRLAVRCLLGTFESELQGPTYADMLSEPSG